MERLFVGILFSNTIIAFTLLIVCLQRRHSVDRGTRILAFCTCASVVWSIGSGLLVFQTTAAGAHIARCIDLYGTVMYMNSIIMLLNYISGFSKKLSRILESFSLLGLLIFAYGLLPDAFTFERTDWGMTFAFANSVYGDIYTVFFVTCALIMLFNIVHMFRSSKKSIVHFGKCFLVVWILILGGSSLDMILPMLGLHSIPGSSIAQFFGLVIVWYAMDFVSHSKITVQNMSQKIYDSLSSPILMLDTEGAIVVYNDAAMDFFNLDRKTPAGTYKMSAFFDIPLDAKYSSDGSLLIFDAFCKSNSIYCNVRANKATDDFHELIGYIVVIADLTEQIEARKKLEEAREDAISANNAKSLFLANMSHEIRTPVNAIMGFSELALTEDISPVLHDYLTDINNASTTLLSSINDILNISKIESGKMDIINEQYSLKTLLKNVSKIISMQASRKELGFSLVLKNDIPSVLYGDDVRIQEILINLLNNSVKYTTSGSITLTVSKEEISREKINLILSVQDTGMGIKDEDLKNLFAAYERMDKEKNHRTEGTGLGLSIVRGYIDLMNGNIEVKSEYGKGSEFIVTIPQGMIDSTPINPDEIMKSEKEEKRFVGLKIKDFKVLVVDDNRVNLKVISKTLEKYGVSADLAISGKDALSICENTDYPIVFMDHMMPEMDGVETMAALRMTSDYYKYTSKIVVLTANAIDGVKAALMGAGFDDYLTKPLNYTELERVLRKYVPAEMIEE